MGCSWIWTMTWLQLPGRAVRVGSARNSSLHVARVPMRQIWRCVMTILSALSLLRFTWWLTACIDCAETTIWFTTCSFTTACSQYVSKMVFPLPNTYRVKSPGEESTSQNKGENTSSLKAKKRELTQLSVTSNPTKDRWRGERKIIQKWKKEENKAQEILQLFCTKFSKIVIDW